MLCIQNIRFLSRVEGLLDRISAPETVLRILIDDTFALPHLPGTTKQNTTTWEEQIPPIELSPYQTKYKIEFALYRQGLLIGIGKTQFGYIQARKDCLDVVDQDFRVSGKLVYQLNWAKSVKSGNYITYEQFMNNKTKTAKVGGKEAILTQQIKTERQRKYVRPEGEEDDCSGGICACFAVRKKKKVEPPPPTPQTREPKMERLPPRAEFDVTTTPRRMQAVGKMQVSSKPALSKFTNNPFVYFEEQLQGGKPNDVQQLNRLSFYSKTIITSK